MHSLQPYQGPNSRSITWEDRSCTPLLAPFQGKKCSHIQAPVASKTRPASEMAASMLQAAASSLDSLAPTCQPPASTSSLQPADFSLMGEPQHPACLASSHQWLALNPKPQVSRLQALASNLEPPAPCIHPGAASGCFLSLPDPPEMSQEYRPYLRTTVFPTFVHCYLGPQRHP